MEIRSSVVERSQKKREARGGNLPNGYRTRSRIARNYKSTGKFTVHGITKFAICEWYSYIRQEKKKITKSNVLVMYININR